MRHILFLNCSKQISGAEKSLLEIVSNFDKNKSHITILSPKDCDLSKKLKSKARVVNVNLQNITKSDLYSINAIFNILRINIKVLKFYRLQKKTIIYCNTWKGLIYCILPKVFVSAQVICHCRDNIKFFQRILILALSRKIIVVSDFIKNQLKTNSNKVVVVPNSLEISKVSFVSDYTIKDKLNMPAGKIIIGNIGQNIKWKNQKEFIKIAGKLNTICRDLYFLLVTYDIGVPDIKLRESIENDIDNNGLRDQIKILPFQKDIYPILSAMDILIHTAEKEPFGRIIIESMLMGCSVVTSKSGGPEEIIEEGETGILINDWDSQKTIDKIELLIRNASFRKQLGENARKEVLLKYDSKNVTKQIESVLDNI